MYRKCTIFLPKPIFFPGGHAPRPPSYGMSDVNPPPYLKAGFAPAFATAFIDSVTMH